MKGLFALIKVICRKALPERQLIIFLALKIQSQFLFAQQSLWPADLKFKADTLNFGRIADTTVIKDFYILTNYGADTVQITDVQPSCGCLVVNWDKHKITTGQTARIQVVFRPENRMGSQQKTFAVYVRYGNHTFTKTLYWIGTVAKAHTHMPHFTHRQGNMVSDKNYFRFGMLHQEKASQKIRILNQSTKPVSLLNASLPERGINIHFSKSTLNAGDTATITLTLTPHDIPFHGVYKDSLFIRTTDISVPEKKFYIFADLLNAQDFQYDSLSAPVLKFLPDSIYIHYTSTSEKINIEFSITNIGRSDLIIYNLTHSLSGCTHLKQNKLTLLPGQSTDIRLQCDSISEKGMLRKSICVYSNSYKTYSSCIDAIINLQ